MEGIVLKIFYSILIPLFALGVVVFVHELGHFLVAKWCGIKVLKFSIGFGPKIWSWQKGETEYRISWLFFGGYVKFLGDELDEEGARTVKGGFYSAKPFFRTLVALAGPGMNLLFGFLIYCGIFILGRPVLLDERTTVIGGILKDSPAQIAGLQVGDRITEIDHRPVSSWKGVLEGIAISPHDKINLKVARKDETLEYQITPEMDPERGFRLIGVSRWERILVGGVEKGSPAEKAGLQKGDLIVGFGGQPVYQWETLTKALELNGAKEASLEIVRDGQRMELKVMPVRNEKENRFMLGFLREIEIVKEHLNPFKAIYQDIVSIFDTLRALFAGTVSPKGLAGPVGILDMIGKFARLYGLVYFLGFMALISINLGILNLLPIPVLDGGHVLFNIIESIRRKALPKKTMILIQNVFVVFLIFFILYVTYQDIMRLGSGFFGKSKDAERQEQSP
jgi:regulator of sigma E protease